MSGNLTHDTDRIRKAVVKGELSFWEVIIKEYPEINTGDFDPGAAFALNGALTDALTTWLHWNEGNPAP